MHMHMYILAYIHFILYVYNIYIHTYIHTYKYVRTMSTSILIHPSRAFKNPKHPSMAIEIRLVHSPAQGSRLIHGFKPKRTGENWLDRGHVYC